MNPVVSFLSTGKKISVNFVVSAHARLCCLQTQHESFTPAEVLNILASIDNEQGGVDPEMKIAICGLIFQKCLHSKCDYFGNVKLTVPSDILTDEFVFIKRLYDSMIDDCGGIETPSVSVFRSETNDYLKRKLSTSQSRYHSDKVTGRTNFNPATVHGSNHTVPEATKISDYPRGAVNGGFMAINGKTSRIVPNIEKMEPIMKMLAQIRKLGMDMLFPQNTHDKVLKIFIYMYKIRI